MPIVESSVNITGSIEQVYALAKGIYASPELMPDLKSITVLEGSADEGRVLSEWVGSIEVLRATVKWTSEDIWDDGAKTCKFSLIKGDHGRYSGQVTFTDLGGSVRIDSGINIEVDVPLVRGFVAKKVKQNLEHMLTGIKARIEAD